MCKKLNKVMGKKSFNPKRIAKIFNKTPKIKKDFNFLKSIDAPKTDLELKVKLDGIKNKSLTKRILASKIIIGSGIAIGISAAYIDNYIKGNTGCFLEKDNEVCKLTALSCCNPHTSSYVETCDSQTVSRLNIDRETCKNYIFSNASCCEKCDCKFYNCQKDEKMSCRKSTVAEALTFFTDNMKTTISDTIHNILSSSIVIQIFLIGVLVIITGIIIYKFI